MMTARQLRTSLYACLTATMLLSIPAAAQDDAFRNGLGARGDKKWAEVVVQMRSAIQMNGAESTRKIRTGFLRLDGVEYLPHFYLGEALFYLGDCTSAVNEWAESQRQGAVNVRRDLVALMQGWYAECARKGVVLPGEFEPLVERAESAISEASSSAREVFDRAQKIPDLWKPGQEFRTRYERARAQVETANTKLASGKRTRSASDLNESRTAAEDARSTFAQMNTELIRVADLRAALSNVAEDAEQALLAAAAAERAINQLLSAGSATAALPPALQALRQKAVDLIARARTRLTAGEKSEDAAVLQEAQKLAHDASSAITDVRDQVARLVSAATDRAFAQEVSVASQVFSAAAQAMDSVVRATTGNAATVRPDTLKEQEDARRLLEDGRRRFDAARRKQDLAGIKDAAGVAAEARDRLTALLATIAPVELTLEQRGVHPALVSASRHYLSGQYREALAALDDPALATPGVPLEIHLHLFRAASLFALYINSAPADDALRSRAEAEIRRCRALDASFRPDSRAFSPRFLRFFEAINGNP